MPPILGQLPFSTVPCTSGSDIWNYSTAFGGLTAKAGSQFWGVQDLDGDCGSSAGETITFATTNVSSYTGISIKFDYDIIGFDLTDDVFYTVILDGVSQTQVQLVTGSSPAFSTGSYVTETIAIPDGTNTVSFILLVDQNGGNDRAAFDNFILEGTAVPGCPHTVTGFAPDSAVTGAEVIITGTGFTSSSTIDFDGTSATTVFVSATELKATVPAGITNGKINITESSCTVPTSADYKTIASGTGCGAAFSNLIMSEVYDQNGGSLGYIEIFNGTASTINLTQYRIDRFADLNSTTKSFSYTFPASGTGSSIAAGQVLVGKVSNDAGTLQDFNFGGLSGFNENDRLELFHIPTATIIDDFHDDVVGARGFIYRRKTNITGPNPTYTASEWTTATAGNVSGLGIYTISTATEPTVTAQPADVSGCSVTFSVAATAGSGGTLTYQWFYNRNDGTHSGWEAVSSCRL